MKESTGTVPVYVTFVNLQSVMSYQQINTLQPSSSTDPQPQAAFPPTTTAYQEHHQQPAQPQPPQQAADTEQQQQ